MIIAVDSFREQEVLWILSNTSCVGVQRAKLLDAKSRSGMYFLEYTVQKPEETEPRHFLSAVALGCNGRWVRALQV